MPSLTSLRHTLAELLTAALEGATPRAAGPDVRRSRPDDGDLVTLQVTASWLRAVRALLKALPTLPRVRVIVEVSGGVIQAIRADDLTTQVVVLDHDDAEAGRPARPFLWEPDPLGSDPETDDRQLLEAALRDGPGVGRQPADPA